MSPLHWKPAAVALGAVLALNGFAPAQEKVIPLGGAKAGGFLAGSTMTLGGTGTVDAAAKDADDTELAHRGGYRGGYYGGYRGGYRGGFGFPYYGGGFGGYRGGFGGYYGGYRPYYGGGFGGFRPYYGGFGYSVGFASYPVYYGSSYYGGYGGGFCGISGTEVDVNTPAVALSLAARPAIGATVIPPVSGTTSYRYNGGPAAPLPQPVAEPGVAPVRPQPPTDDLNVAFKGKVETKKLGYKAYGEK